MPDKQPAMPKDRPTFKSIDKSLNRLKALLQAKLDISDNAIANNGVTKRVAKRLPLSIQPEACIADIKLALNNLEAIQAFYQQRYQDADTISKLFIETLYARFLKDILQFTNKNFTENDFSKLLQDNSDYKDMWDIAIYGKNVYHLCAAIAWFTMVTISIAVILFAAPLLIQPTTALFGIGIITTATVALLASAGKFSSHLTSFQNTAPINANFKNQQTFFETLNKMPITKRIVAITLCPEAITVDLKDAASPK